MAKIKPKKKKAGKKWWIIVPLILAVTITSGYFLYKWISISRAKFVRYPAFGIDIPDSYEIHGIDVSKYQSFIDWPSVKEMKVNDVHIGFAFIKATEGLGNVDKQFKRNWKKSCGSRCAKRRLSLFLVYEKRQNSSSKFYKKCRT